MMRLNVISISGLDGSGKSTQASMLIDYLNITGNKTYYFHSIKNSIAQLILKRNSNTDKESGVTNASELSIALRRLALKFDIIRFNRLRKSLEKKGFSYIVSDRYFYDTLVNISYLKQSNVLVKAKVPSPDYAFYLSIKPEEIMNRRRKPEQGINYLIDKQELYFKLIERFGVNVIDASKSQRNIHIDIRNTVLNQ